MVAHQDRVPNALFRGAVLRAVERGDSFSQIAIRGGLIAPDSSGRTSYLKRILGLREWPPSVKNGKRYPAYPSHDYMSYDAAVKLCRALNLDPTDCGI